MEVKKLNKKVILGIAVCLILSAATVFAAYDNKPQSNSENSLEKKLTASEFEEMNGIIKKVNSGELPISPLKDAEVLLERGPYYVKPETLKAYQELAQ